MTDIRPQRSRKRVDYTAFAGGGNDDDDFENPSSSASKKCKLEQSNKLKLKPKPNSKVIELDSSSAASDDEKPIKVRRGLAQRKPLNERVYGKELELVMEISKQEQTLPEDSVKDIKCEVDIKEHILESVPKETLLLSSIETIQTKEENNVMIVNDGEIPSTSRQRVASTRKCVIDDDDESDSYESDLSEEVYSSEPSESDFSAESDGSDYENTSSRNNKQNVKKIPKMEKRKAGSTCNKLQKAKTSPKTDIKSNTRGRRNNPSLVLVKTDISALNGKSQIVVVKETKSKTVATDKEPIMSRRSVELLPVKTVSNGSSKDISKPDDSTEKVSDKVVSRLKQNSAVTNLTPISPKPTTNSQRNSFCSPLLSNPQASTGRSPLAGLQIKSPGGLRIGLSRNRRGKSLHSNVKLPT